MVNDKICNRCKSELNPDIPKKSGVAIFMEGKFIIGYLCKPCWKLYKNLLIKFDLWED